jgi:hypothetical protein
MSEPYDVHTCHAECPCQRGEEPPKDFLSIEGSLLPGLLALARLRQRTGIPFPWERTTDEHGT